MSKLKKGDNVKVHYTGKTNGEVFDSSIEREPLEFKIGEGQIIFGFEQAVTNLEVGEKVKVNLSAEEGYGERIPQMIQQIPLGNLPEGVTPGSQVQGTGPMGEPVIATVGQINEGMAEIDFNHPLAGKELEFEIELLEVSESESNGESETPSK